MNRGHFRGHFLVIYHGCPIDSNFWFPVKCRSCIYYINGCTNYSVYFGNHGSGHYLKK